MNLDQRIAKAGWVPATAPFRKGQYYLNGRYAELDDLRREFEKAEPDRLVPCAVYPNTHGHHLISQPCGSCPPPAPTFDVDTWGAFLRRMSLNEGVDHYLLRASKFESPRIGLVHVSAREDYLLVYRDDRKGGYVMLFGKGDPAGFWYVKPEEIRKLLEWADRQ